MKKQFIFHPFLFGVLPILCLLSSNLGRMVSTVYEEIYIPIIIVTILTSLLWCVISFFSGSKKAAIIASLFITLFFSFGHLRHMTRLQPSTILVIAAFLFFLFSTLVLRSQKNLSVVTGILNKIAFILVAVQLLILGIHEGGRTLELSRILKDSRNLKAVTDARRGPRPDIYYIILDSYARADTLSRVYGYDNSGLLDYLSRRKFYIAKKSSSNYSYTEFSLASSLNLDYLDSLAKLSHTRWINGGWYTQLLKNNAVIRYLKSFGYTIITFATVPNIVCDEGTDLCFRPEQVLSEFQTELLKITPVSYLMKKLGISGFDLYRNKILFTFNHLDRVLGARRPVFVFAHILCPHPPFVFDHEGKAVGNNGNLFSVEDGSDLRSTLSLTPDAYRKAYVEQLAFENKLVEKTLDRIFSRAADHPLVVILQGDHGPRSDGNWDNLNAINMQERMNILNAYYFSDGDYHRLYDVISPVNSFRIVFNKYFSSAHLRLPDRSIFISGHDRTIMTDVSDRV